MPGGDLDRFVEAAALDQVETAERLLRLGEGAVGHELLAASYANGLRAVRWRELVADLPDLARLKVVEPRESLVVLVLGPRLGLHLRIHLLGVPGDQQQVLHVAPLVVFSGRRTRLSGIDISSGRAVTEWP